MSEKRYSNLDIVQRVLGAWAPLPGSVLHKAILGTCKQLGDQPFPRLGLVGLLIYARLTALGWSPSRGADALAMAVNLLELREPPALVRFDGQRLIPVQPGEPQPPVAVLISFEPLLAEVNQKLAELTGPSSNAALN